MGKFIGLDTFYQSMIKEEKNSSLVIIGMIITIVLAIVGWYTLTSPDFIISANPMQCSCLAGGVIQTTVTVENTHSIIKRYKYPVRLSTVIQSSNQPIIITLNPSHECIPEYDSTVNINVGSDVQAGDYTIIITGIGANGKEHNCSYTLTVKPSVTPTPTPTPTETHPSNAKNIIDSMESTLFWKTNKFTGSSINIKSVPGRTDNGIEISYDLEELGWVEISKEIHPEILYKYKGLRFYYKGSGEPNTIELKLIYEDTTTFGVAWNRATVADNWITLEVPYSHFDCWWPVGNCQGYGNELDLEKVRKIEFAISNKPDNKDVYGSGWVIIDDVQGIAS